MSNDLQKENASNLEKLSDATVEILRRGKTIERLEKREQNYLFLLREKDAALKEAVEALEDCRSKLRVHYKGSDWLRIFDLKLSKIKPLLK